jgi:hypothetical protein
MPSLILSVLGEEAILEALKDHREGAQVIGRLDAAIGASAPYAGYVHGGTSRMPARPFLSNAIAKNAPRFEQELADAVPKGGTATARALLTGTNQILDDARAEAPVRTGYLRGSLYVKLGGIGG